MKRTKNKIIFVFFTTLFLSLGLELTAEDADFSDFDAFSSGDTQSDDAVKSDDDFGGFDDFGGSPDAEESKKPFPLSFGGTVGLDIRGYLDTIHGYSSFNDIGENTSMDFNPFFKFNIKFEEKYCDLEAKLKFNKWTLTDWKWDILDEFTVRVYLKDFVFEAGKMRLVWGKGDKLHVLDNFNANDYTDFVIPDYIDRRVAEPMFHAVYNAPIKANLRLEAAWTPVMTPDRFDSKHWEPYKTVSLRNSVKGYLANNFTSTFTNYTKATALAGELKTLGSLASVGDANAKSAFDKLMKENNFTSESDIESFLSLASLRYINALNTANSFDEDDLYEDTYSLKFGQLGGRITWTLGQVDLGVSYYYGHNKEPSASYKKVFDPSDGTSAWVLDSLSYDTLHVFGLEMATVLWKFNIRSELAYNMTTDYAGDDPFTHNNSISYLFGFDIDLPFSNFNINIQDLGTALLKIDGIDESFDVNRDTDSLYTNNKLVVNISDKYLHDKLSWELVTIIGLERGEVALLPKISYNIKGGFFIVANACYLHAHNENGEFYNFTAYQSGTETHTTDKVFIQFGARYDF